MISKKDRKEPHITALERVASLTLTIRDALEFRREYPAQLDAALETIIATSGASEAAELRALFAPAPVRQALDLAMEWGFRHAEKGNNLEHARIEFAKVCAGKVIKS